MDSISSQRGEAGHPAWLITKRSSVQFRPLQPILFALIFCLFAVNSFGAATVYFPFNDLSSGAFSNKVTEITDTRGVITNSIPGITVGVKKRYTNSAAGDLYVTNMLPSSYRVDVLGTPPVSFNILLTNESGTVNAATDGIITASTNTADGLVSYSQAQANGKFMPKTGTTNADVIFKYVQLRGTNAPTVGDVWTALDTSGHGYWSTPTTGSGDSTNGVNARITTATNTVTTNLTAMIAAVSTNKNVLRVDKGGNDSIAVKGGNAWLNLTNAITNAVAGDIVFLENGIWTNTTQITIPKGVTILGKGWENTIIKSDVDFFSGAAVTPSDNCRIIGVQIDARAVGYYVNPFGFSFLDSTSWATNVVAYETFFNGRSDSVYAGSSTNGIVGDFIRCRFDSEEDFIANGGGYIRVIDGFWQWGSGAATNHTFRLAQHNTTNATTEIIGGQAHVRTNGSFSWVSGVGTFKINGVIVSAHSGITNYNITNVVGNCSINGTNFNNKTFAASGAFTGTVSGADATATNEFLTFNQFRNWGTDMNGGGHTLSNLASVGAAAVSGTIITGELFFGDGSNLTGKQPSSQTLSNLSSMGNDSFVVTNIVFSPGNSQTNKFLGITNNVAYIQNRTNSAGGGGGSQSPLTGTVNGASTNSITNLATISLVGKSGATTVSAIGGEGATWVFEFFDSDTNSIGGVANNGDFSLTGNFVAVKGIYAYGTGGEGGVHVQDNSDFGGFQLKNLADGSDDDDAATVQQIILSDRNKKEHFKPAPNVLDKVLQFDLQTYNFKPSTKTNRLVKRIEGEKKLKFETNVVVTTVERPEKHLGVMAQDFKAAFGLGKDDKTIDPRDAAGVAYKAIQELNAKYAAEIARLEKRIEALEKK